MAQNDFTNLIIWSSLWSLAQIFVRFSRGHFLGIEDELQQICFIIDTFENVQNNPHIGPLIKIRGSKMILAEQALRWAQRKFYLMQFWLRNLTFKVGFFQFFRKSWKFAILFCRFHHENTIPRKNGVHHEKANGKCNKTVDSDFWFLKLCHRDFSPQCSLLLKKNIFRFYDKNLRFRRSLKKPSQLLNGSTDFQYQYVKIKSTKARTFWYIW